MAASEISAAVALVLDDKKQISDIRISLGAIAPTAIRCRKIEKSLLGKEPARGLMKEISDNTCDELYSNTDNHDLENFQDHTAAVVIHRALETAAEQAYWRT